MLVKTKKVRLLKKLKKIHQASNKKSLKKTK